MSEAPLLEVRDLEVAYGHVQAVRGISLSVRRGQIVTLIGPNGAGKSSTLNAIAGLVRPRRGAVLLEGRDVAGWDLTGCDGDADDGHHPTVRPEHRGGDL